MIQIESGCYNVLETYKTASEFLESVKIYGWFGFCEMFDW